MKKLLALTIFSFCFLLMNAQQSKTPVLSKVTATWCPKCGDWGWDFMEEMKAKYNNGSEAVILGIHYSGNLRNPTAEWFAANLKPFGQPVFYANNEDQNISRTNWEDRIPLVNDKLSEFGSQEPVQRFSFKNAYINSDNQIVANVTFEPHEEVDNDYYFGVYIFENNVQETQSPRGISSHPNVLRDVISDNPFGDFAFGNGDVQVAADVVVEYTKIMDSDWDGNNVGLVGILWRKEGNDYIIDNSAVIYNIGLLSSSIELIDEDLVEVKSMADHIVIAIDSNEDYNVSLINPLGQVVSNSVFNRNTTINTLNLTSGIYTVHLSQGNSILSKQIFVNN